MVCDRSKPGQRYMSESRQATSRLRVLHLEDNSLDAELIRNELEEHDIHCNFTQIHNRQAFEAELQKGRVDLILSDSQLPGFDTMSALALTRQRFQNLPFIFVSGSTSFNVKGEAFRKGATDFIGKDNLPKLARVVQWMFFINRWPRRRPVLPEMGTPVVVQCRGFCSLGFLGRDGKWRDFETSTELSDVIDWSEI
jgi:CheY-like chemotaxis protein